MAVVVTYDTPADKGRTAQFPNLVRRGTVAIGAYVTSGVAVTRATFDLPTSLDDLRLDSASGYVARWDRANAKVMVYDQKDPAAAGGADIALPEVGNSVDLSAVGFRFVATGR